MQATNSKRTRRTRAFMAAMFASMALVAVSAAAAQAAPFHLDWNYGFTDEGSQKKVVAINNSTPVTMDGEITGTAFTVPDGGVNWPPQKLTKPIPATSETEVKEVHGTYDAATGQMSLTGKFTFYSNNAITKKCKIGPVELTLSTESTEPYFGERFLSGLTGEGAIDTKWDKLPNPEAAEVGANCSLIQKLTEAPGGLWISHNIAEPRTPGGPGGGGGGGGGTTTAKAALSVKLSGKKSVTGGKKAKITVKVSNTGGATATGIKVCATVKKPLKPSACQKVSSLAAGKSVSKTFTIKTKKVKKAKTAKITIKTSASSLSTKSNTFKLKVKP